MAANESKELMDAHVDEHLIQKRDKRLKSTLKKGDAPKQGWSRAQAMEWISKNNIRHQSITKKNA
ncbi:hypothetical protein [Hydromonas duriensis]|uniref:Uncharacterized protein n=1 Tax=Hydromonas duriensis TaxID=1527608 RepID=A0A4R6Y763_9BURK|nr:hypothetical protein [Hydromonas duriensis]TDR31093.1 hypothetical protein DFR44_11346 [Hydromonas duriensis]